VKALQLQRFGSLDDLQLRDVAPASLPANSVRVAIEAAAVNPSDVGVVMGRFPQVTLPRVLGRDFAGRIVEGPNELLGLEVWGSGGGTLGVTRDGTHAQEVVLPVEAVVERPDNLSTPEAAAVGVPYVTAWNALVNLAQFTPGEWALIAGAAGAVGMAAISLAKAMGGHAIGVVRSTDDIEALNGLGVDAVLHSENDDIAAEVKRLTGGPGANVALNGVGASVFAPLTAALANDGRMVVYSVIGGREAQLDLFRFYRGRLRFFGLDTAALDLAEIRTIYEGLNPLFSAGALRPPRIAKTVPLSQGRAAYEAVQNGVKGKVVLLPQEA
jgi:NADPH:quinone reductase